jgi:hypothetical protein
VRGGRQTLNFVAFPGHQGPTILNNVHLVTSPEGVSVIQTGDQWGDDVSGSDFDWLTKISRVHKVDVLLPDCWTKGLDRIVRGVNPAVVIRDHENEMAHTVDHREDYTQTYTRMHGLRHPLLLMTCGESWQYRRAAGVASRRP